MDKKDLIKYALIAGGAYLIYTYLKSSGVLDGLFSTATTPAVGAGTGTGTTPAAGAGTGTGTNTAGSGTGTGAGTGTTPPAVTPPPAVTTEALILAAAAGDRAKAAILDSQAVKMNSDEWNWYRAKATSQVTDVDLFPAGDRAYKMTATQYLDARTAHGLSGMDDYFAHGAAAINSWVV